MFIYLNNNNNLHSVKVLYLHDRNVVILPTHKDVSSICNVKSTVHGAEDHRK